LGFRSPRVARTGAALSTDRFGLGGSKGRLHQPPTGGISQSLVGTRPQPYLYGRAAASARSTAILCPLPPNFSADVAPDYARVSHFRGTRSRGLGGNRARCRFCLPPAEFPHDGIH